MRVTTATPLPHWPRGTPGVLVVAGLHAIPISTSQRADDARVIFALGRRRETLRRLRDDPSAALCMLGEGVAFTASGRARVLQEQLETVPVAALELVVELVQDHLADGRTEMLAGARWRWRDSKAAAADEQVVAELTKLAAAFGRDPRS